MRKFNFLKLGSVGTVNANFNGCVPTPLNGSKHPVNVFEICAVGNFNEKSSRTRQHETARLLYMQCGKDSWR
jgi:hypothetical protein